MSSMCSLEVSNVSSSAMDRYTVSNIPWTVRVNTHLKPGNTDNDG